MKSQQRKFVVEFKSTRRRSAVRPNSIWADTDLKSLVREAEADAPHLFDSNMVSKTPVQDSELQPNSSLDDTIETGDDERLLASLAGAEQTYSPQKDNEPTVSSVSKLKEDSSARRSLKASARQGEASVHYQVYSTETPPGARSTAALVEATSDELVALDQENRRLKGLLAKHLLLQNTQLRKMLARFGDF
ncbi:hypothetical protein [Pararhizobium sp. A13]|uniref:hypothetical protein n=1 Tax=Pararhizobium sp. A13 TaxID=3133975 RepID=UPI00311AE4E7